MGIYIRNIDIPEIKRGVAAIINIDDILFLKTEDDILLVPDHGDLIEKDVVLDGLDLMAANNRLHDAYDFVKSCEAVIPAERSEE
jgi:hypothetical protein